MNGLNASTFIDPANFDKLVNMGPPADQLARTSAKAAESRARSAGARQHPATSDKPYTDEDRRFLMAIQAYKQRTGRTFLMATEFLDVLKSLGYFTAGSATPAP